MDAKQGGARVTKGERKESKNECGTRIGNVVASRWVHARWVGDDERGRKSQRARSKLADQRGIRRIGEKQRK